MSETTAPPVESQAGKTTAIAAGLVLVAVRIVDVWLAQDQERSTPWVQLVAAGYFAARLLMGSQFARWITVGLALVLAWFDLTRHTAPPTPDLARYAMAGAGVIVAILLVRGPGVNRWFAQRR